jgi:hypothetical protein
LVVKTLDPDWIRIQPKTLDPDLESKNLDPKHCSLAVDSHHLFEDPYPHKKAVDRAFLLAAGLDLNEDSLKNYKYLYSAYFFLSRKCSEKQRVRYEQCFFAQVFLIRVFLGLLDLDPDP